MKLTRNEKMRLGLAGFVVALGFSTIGYFVQRDINEGNFVEPIRICEYVDRDGNGKYDGMRFVHSPKTQGEINFEFFYGERYKSISFAEPNSGTRTEGEFSREQLENMFEIYAFPDVDSLRFVEE